MKSYNYTDKDYDEVVEFLGELYQLDDRRPYWLPGRWEYASYLCNPLFSERGYPDWKQYIRIVRDGNSIVGLANSENPDHVKACRRVIEVAKKNGVIPGIHTGSLKSARRWMEEGIGWLVSVRISSLFQRFRVSTPGR